MMTKSRKLTIGLAVVVFALGVTAAGAVTGGTTRSAQAQLGIQTATRTASTYSTSMSFVTVEGATTTFTAAANVLVVATFSAEATCADLDPPAVPSYIYCSARIVVDSTEMNPAAGSDFAFAYPSVNHGTLIAQAASMQRSLLVGPGTHTVKVQRMVTSPNLSFTLDDWQLTTTESSNPV
jgi:hypothetical protein